MEYSKEDLMEAKKQIWGVGENMGTEESKKIWEKNAQFWDNAMGDESNEFHREVVRPKVTELLSPNPADYILDIACGNGNYSSYLAQRGASVVAFDYSKKMIELAKRRQSQYTELYQIIYFTPKDKGLGVLKEALWATFNGAAYYRNPRKVSANQLSLITAEMEEKIALDTEQYIISCNVEEARRIILSLPQKTHLAYKDIALPILERTMLKNGHLKKHIFQAFIKEGIVRKLNEHVRKNNFIDDFYDIIG